MKYMVTGASGFVGGHLLNQLAAEENSEIVALYNSNYPSQSVIDDKLIRCIKRDIVRDDLSGLCLGIDIVFHTAGFASNFESSEICDKLMSVNLLGTLRLAITARDEGVTRFVFVSSVAACESSLESIVHEDNGFPISCYGRSKRVAEILLLALHSKTFNVTIVRPTALFGEDHLGSVFELCRLVSINRFVIIGSGLNCVNFLYIKDFIADLVYVAKSSAACGGIYICSDNLCQLNSFIIQVKFALGVDNSTYRIPLWAGHVLGFVADILKSVSGRSLPISGKRVVAMTKNIYYSSDRLRIDLKSEMPNGIQQGLINTIKWYRLNGFL
jgi:nucleoside-diphosphate-sugar epimerase